ncbi:MAG: hypothetical protein ACK48V_03885 [Crocinitomicaceae bacterium]|jgi:hypothetical protein
MISIPKSSVEQQIALCLDKFNAHKKSIKLNLITLKRSCKKDMSSDEVLFLDKIIDEFKKGADNILTTFDLDSIKNRIGEQPVKKLKQIRKDKILYLNDLILMSFGYDSLRANFYPTFYDQLGIKSCVYCNSQLAVSVSKNRYPISKKGRIKPLYSLGDEIVAKYQLDHYYPKSKYPYLSASVYNLYPTCATCNNIKRANEVNFQLYSEKTTPSKYQFSLDKIGKAKYLITGRIEYIQIKFDDPDKIDKNIKSPCSFEDTFHISSIYNTQIDLVQELFLKKKIYDDVYKSILKSSFKQLFNDVNLSNRILLGNYVHENEIHKRPMAKFMQDIAHDIGFIKKNE